MEQLVLDGFNAVLFLHDSPLAFGIFTTILGFLMMLCFLFRIPDPVISSTHVLAPYRSEERMTQVHNPFVLTLSSEKQCLSSGVKVLVSSDVPVNIICYWAVTIEEFYAKLWQGIEEFFVKLETCDLFTDVAMVSGIHEPCEKKLVTYRIPDTDTDSFLCTMGDVPRKKYPLIIIMYENKEDLDMHVEDIKPKTIAMVTVIHLKDSVCNVDSHIMAQFIKLSDGQVLSLKQLYTVSTNSDSCKTSSEDYSCTEDKCVVCQVADISRVILPCRHACLCQGCFTLIDKCPICRGFIKSYFDTESKDDDTINNDSTQDDCDIQNATWWENTNNRVNQLFGIR